MDDGRQAMAKPHIAFVRWAKNYVDVKKITTVAMVTKIAIYLHFTRKKQYIGIEKVIFHSNATNSNKTEISY